MKPVDYAIGALSAAEFLRDYWQKKPLLIRQALPDFISPLSPEEVAGLACESFAESRLIRELPAGWQLQHGPFEETDFQALPSSHWTLHVQGIERYVPDIYALLDHFRLIPNWRIDDVMVSFAPDQGTAGPHFDQYDVFLVQGLGEKHWRIGQQCNASTPLLPDCDLSILQQFETADEWIVEPGDVLYIPPGLAHYGIAVGDSMTYSIGFRAPSHADLLGEFSHFCASLFGEHERYADPDLSLQENPGQIRPEAVDKLQQILQDALNDKQRLAHWFGQFMTEPKQAEPGEIPEPLPSTQELAALLKQADSLHWEEGARYAFYEQPDGLEFYVNGQCYACDAQLRPLLCRLCASTRTPTVELLGFEAPEAQQLLLTLYNEGLFYLE